MLADQDCFVHRQNSKVSVGQDFAPCSTRQVVSYQDICCYCSTEFGYFCFQKCNSKNVGVIGTGNVGHVLGQHELLLSFGFRSFVRLVPPNSPSNAQQPLGIVCLNSNTSTLFLIINSSSRRLHLARHHSLQVRQARPLGAHRHARRCEAGRGVGDWERDAGRLGTTFYVGTDVMMFFCKRV